MLLSSALEGYETDGSAIVIGWETSVMLRKLLVTLAGAGISDPYLQIIAALMILIISFGLQSFFQPYEPIALDVLDSLGIFCLLCTQILSILYLYVDTSSTLVVNKTVLEYTVTFGLFLMNGIALISFLAGYAIAYLQLDWWSLRCKKREMLWLVEDIEVFGRELAKQLGKLEESGAAGGAANEETNEEAGRVWYFWKHPTNGKVMTWPPKRMSKADDGTAQDHWVWYGENGHPESLSVEAPQLFERAPIDEKRELLPGDRTCLFDAKRMEATPLREVPHDLGGISLCCKKVEVRPRRRGLAEKEEGALPDTENPMKTTVAGAEKRLFETVEAGKDAKDGVRKEKKKWTAAEKKALRSSRRAKRQSKRLARMEGGRAEKEEGALPDTENPMKTTVDGAVLAKGAQSILQGVELGSVEAEQVALEALRKKQKAKVMIQIGKRKAKKLRQAKAAEKEAAAENFSNPMHSDSATL